MKASSMLRAASPLLLAVTTVFAFACSEPAKETPPAAPAAPTAAEPAAAAPAPHAGEASPDGTESAGAAHEGAAALDRSPLGIFQGTLPCADCEGIKTELTLYLEPDTFELKETYFGGREGEKTLTSEGSWTTLEGGPATPNGTVVQLNPDKPDAARSFLEVGADGLEQLDREGKRIESKLNYTLSRAPDAKAGS